MQTNIGYDERDSVNKVWEWQHLTCITGACPFTEVFNKTGNSVEQETKTTMNILPRTFK